VGSHSEGETDNLANEHKEKMEEYKKQLKLAAVEVRGELPAIGGMDLQQVSELAKSLYVQSVVTQV
jgi:hypothetical protein